jgi:hypothetical protein
MSRADRMALIEHQQTSGTIAEVSGGTTWVEPSESVLSTGSTAAQGSGDQTSDRRDLHQVAVLWFPSCQGDPFQRIEYFTDNYPEIHA